MILRVYSVFDDAARVFKFQFFRSRDGEAIRYFADGVQAEKTEMHKHPQDFSLFVLAEFNDETGLFSPLSIPERISRALDFVQPGGVL